MLAPARSRRGLGLFEIIITISLLGTLAVIGLPLVSAYLQAERTLQQRELALREAHNLLERLSLLPWNDLTPDTLATWKPADEIARQLPGLEWTITVTPQPASAQSASSPSKTPDNDPPPKTPDAPPPDANRNPAGPLAAKRLDVEVRWPETRGDRAAAPLRLTTWRYITGRPSP